MRYIGIDVAGSKKDQVVAVLNEKLEIEKVLFEKVCSKEDADKLARKIYEEYGEDSIIAIDASRFLSKGPQNGRECEREIKSRNLANPQFTPTRETFDPVKHDWFQIGFYLFDAFGIQRPNVIEVFPTASYNCLKKSKVFFSLPIHFVSKKTGQDLLDAVCAAVTAHCYNKGEFAAYGSDEEGKIIVPAIKKRSRGIA
jgi:predicted nuclease with RNAse H fold